MRVVSVTRDYKRGRGCVPMQCFPQETKLPNTARHLALRTLGVEVRRGTQGS